MTGHASSEADRLREAISAALAAHASPRFVINLLTDVAADLRPSDRAEAIAVLDGIADIARQAAQSGEPRDAHTETTPTTGADRGVLHPRARQAIQRAAEIAYETTAQ